MQVKEYKTHGILFRGKKKKGDKDQSSSLWKIWHITDTFFYMEYNHSLNPSWTTSANQALDATEVPFLGSLFQGSGIEFTGLSTY